MTMPSSSASRISASSAGIRSFDPRSRVSRQTTQTSAEPVLLAVRAASMATLPPPITSTFEPSETVSPELIRFR